MPAQRPKSKLLTTVAIVSTLAVGGAIAAPAAYASPNLSIRAGVLEDLFGSDLTATELEAFLGTLTEDELTALLTELAALEEFDLAGLLPGLDLAELETILDAMDSAELEDLVDYLVDSDPSLVEQILDELTEGQLINLFEAILDSPIGSLLEGLLTLLGLGSVYDLVDALLTAVGTALTDLVNALLSFLGVDNLLDALFESLSDEELVQVVIDVFDEDGIGVVLDALEELGMIGEIVAALGVQGVVDNLDLELLITNISIVSPIIDEVNQDNAATIDSDTPTISGKERYQKVLTADPGEWDATVLTYVWERDGVPIPGADTSSYQLALDDIGTQISVEVTGYKTDAAPVTEVSAPTDEVEKAKFPDSAKPKVGGEAKVGNTVKAKGLKPYGDEAEFEYRWLKNSNDKIKDATERKLKIKKKYDINKLRVKVIASAPGYLKSKDLSKKVTVKK